MNRRYGDGSDETDYCVKMLDDYRIRNPINPDHNQSWNRKITFTTAERNESELKDGDIYMYRGSKDNAKVSRRTKIGKGSHSFMFYQHGYSDLLLKEITLDGGIVFEKNGDKYVRDGDGYLKFDREANKNTISVKDGVLDCLSNNSTLTVGKDATLQNAYTEPQSGQISTCLK